MNDIGPYKVSGELGRGGMGVVYRARDTRLDRDVAIKALPEDLASDAMRLERFEREAKTLASVSHSNIAGIYGVEEVDGARYLVLEYVEGVTLADRLDAGAMDTDEAVELAVQIANGVAAAHEAGVVHRDLKPANIVITPEGQPKVLDFGLARADEGQSSTGTSEAATLSTPMQQTALGMVVGTAAYMSPEQARGRRVDKRTDIWSFGVILYEMLSGSSPFVGETATDSIGAVLHKELELDRLPPGVPMGVRRVIERCLERDKNLRYRDIGDVAIELRRGAEEPAPAAAQGKRGVGVLLVAALALLAAAVGAGAVWVAKPGAEPRELRLSVAGPPEDALTYASMDPQGRYVMYGASPIDDATRQRASYIRWLDDHESMRIDASESQRWASTSPDGDWLAFAAPVSQGSSEYALIKQVASLELPPVRVCILPESNAISFFRHLWLSPDRFLLDDSRTNQVRWVDAESGAISDPVVLDLGDYGGRYTGLRRRVDDDRALVALSRTTDQGSQADVGLLDMRTATVSLLVENTDTAHIGPDGSLLFTRGATLYGAELDLETATLGPAKQLIADLRVNGNEIDASFSLSRDGTIIFLPGGVQGADRDLKIGLRDGSFEPLGVESKPYLEQVSVSPDESRAVVVVNSPSNQLEIWGTELDSPRMRRVRGGEGGDLNYPFLAADNDTMVYMRAIDGRAAIEVASFDGLFEPRLIVEPVPVGFVAPVAVHPSGDRALVLWENPDGFRNYEVKLDGSEPMRMIIDNGSNIVWSDYSPDGTMIAYTSDETGRREAYVRTIRDDGTFGRAVPVTTRGARAVQWQLDPARRPGAPVADPPIDPSGPLTLMVFTREGVDAYPVTPGARPAVGEPERNVFERPPDVVGFGASLSGGRQLRIFRGENEKPAQHIELVLNWYDEAAKLIRD